jgi:hypothetical protein
MRIRTMLAVLAGGVMLAATATVAVAGVSSSPGSTAKEATTSSTYQYRECGYGQLSASLHGYQTGYQFGQRYQSTAGFLLTLTNVSNQSCTVDGYPGLQLLNSSKQPIPTKTVWGSTYFDTDPGASALSLSPGETVSADIAFTVRSASTPLYLPQASSYLEVTPPNSYQHFTLAMPRGPVYVWPSTVTVTCMARHTPYGTPFVWPW